ncbi:hypothetical protein [Infirmifilum uzonense]|nr:hypothetical protein [Infirmifilum uzonense]
MVFIRPCLPLEFIEGSASSYNPVRVNSLQALISFKELGESSSI